MYVIRVWKNFKRYILHPLSRNDNTFTLLLKFPNFHFYTRQLIFENSFSMNKKKKKKKQEERRFPEFHLYPGSLSVSRFLLMILGYKTSVGGGRRERENKGGGWRKRMKEKEREREKVRIVNWIWRLARWALSRWHERHYFIRPDTSRAGQAKRRKMIAASHQGSSSGLEI